MTSFLAQAQHKLIWANLFLAHALSKNYNPSSLEVQLLINVQFHHLLKMKAQIFSSKNLQPMQRQELSKDLRKKILIHLVFFQINNTWMNLQNFSTLQPLVHAQSMTLEASSVVTVKMERINIMFTFGKMIVILQIHLLFHFLLKVSFLALLFVKVGKVLLEQKLP